MASTREEAELLHQTERWYAEFCARRDQLQAEYEQERRKAENATNEAIRQAEAEFHQNMQLVAANGATSIRMVEEVMNTKRSLKIKELQLQLEETRTKMQQHYQKLLLDHSEKFSEEFLLRLKSKPAPSYSPGNEQRSLSASRPPPSPVRQSDIPIYARTPLGSNVDRPPTHDHNRQEHPHQLQQGTFRQAEYPPRGVPLRSQPGPPPPTEPVPTRYFGQPPGPSRSTSSEYSTPIGPDRQQQHRPWTQLSYAQHPNGHALDGRLRAPVVPSQQMPLPLTPRTAEPPRAIDPFRTTGSLSASPRQPFRMAEGLRANTNTHSDKRKSDARDDSQTQLPSPKRTRSVGVQGSGPSGDKAGDDSGLDKAQSAIPRPVVKRTIDFSEVYQEGDAEYKHIIIQYPQGDSAGDWYILKCDLHGVHFNHNPLHGAAKHLHSAQHNNMSKEHSLAIRELGHLVWDCTKELADKNNDAVRKAFDNGYKAFNRNQLSKTERKSMGFVEPETSSARKSSGAGAAQAQRKKEKPEQGAVGTKETAAGIAYPVDGELYLCWWNRNKTHYAVILLPWGDLEPCTGIPGTLKDTGLLEKPPKCYRINRLTHEVIGWAEGYEDGGPLVHKRDFPVMYFDNADRKNSVGWVHAKDLSRFNFDDPNWRNIPFYTDARDRYAAAQPENFSSYQSMKDYYEARGKPLKRLSDVRAPPKVATEDAAVQPVTEHGMDDHKSPPREGPVEANGRGGPVDVEMHDVSRNDDMESEGESATDGPHSDEDVEMGNAESRRTSVSNKGPEGNATDASEKPAADTITSNGNVSATAMEASAGQTGNSGKGDKDEESAHGLAVEAADKIVVAVADGKELPEVGHRSPSAKSDRLEKAGATTNGDSTTKDSTVHEEEAAANSIIVYDIATRPTPSQPTDEQGSKDGDIPPVATAAPLLSDSSSAISSPPSPGSSSPTPTPVAALASPRLSRTSTPTVVRADEIAASGRWQAVRKESTPQAVASAHPASKARSATPSANEEKAREPSVQAVPTPISRSRTGTPLATRQGGDDQFEIAYYEDTTGSKFQKQKDGPSLHMVINKATNTCETTPGQPMDLKIDPLEIARVQLDSLDEDSSSCLVTVSLKKEVEGPKQFQLVFETSKSNGREETGRIHARRFTMWARKVNNSMDYLNNRFNSEKPATGYSRT